ncbi:hypothetical protein ACWGNU_02550 [Paenibacillus lautus]
MMELYRDVHVHSETFHYTPSSLHIFTLESRTTICGINFTARSSLGIPIMPSIRISQKKLDKFTAALPDRTNNTVSK